MRPRKTVLVNKGGQTIVAPANPSMTRRHFVERAQVIARIEDPEERKTEAYKWAQIFGSENYRFDLDRFLKACNVED